MPKRKALTNKPGKNVKKTANFGPMDRFVKRNGSSILNGSDSIKDQSSSSSSVIPVSRANLCGETDSDSVVSLVCEWIRTEPELLDEDVAYIMKYLLELVEDQSFDILSKVVEAYYHSVQVRNEESWKQAYNGIVICLESELYSSASSPKNVHFNQFGEHS